MKGLEIFYKSFEKNLNKRFFATVKKDSAVFYLGGDYFFMKYERFYADMPPFPTADIDTFLGEKETRTFGFPSFEKFQDLRDHFPESLQNFAEHTEFPDCPLETLLLQGFKNLKVTISAQGGEITRFLYKLIPFMRGEPQKVCCIRFKKDSAVEGYHRELSEQELPKGFHTASLSTQALVLFSKKTEYRFFDSEYILNFISLFPSKSLFFLYFGGEYDLIRISQSPEITLYLMPVRKIAHDEEKIFALLDEIKKI